MAALRRWLAMHAVLAAAATTLRDLCPNKHFEATLEDIDDEVLRGPPYDDVRDQLALRQATEGRKGLEIGGPTPLAANLYGLLASCDNLATSRPASVLRTVNTTRFAATAWGQYIMQTHTQVRGSLPRATRARRRRGLCPSRRSDRQNINRRRVESNQSRRRGLLRIPVRVTCIGTYKGPAWSFTKLGRRLGAGRDALPRATLEGGHV